VETEGYKKALLAKERELTASERRAAGNVRDGAGDGVGDWSDGAVVDEDKSLAVSEAAMSSDLLDEVRAALTRIEDGSFGMCAADGKPIEEKRLKHVPWAKYCLKHQEEIEKESPPQIATL